jgi:hypothetical protein
VPVEKHYLTILAEAIATSTQTVDRALAHLRARYRGTAGLLSASGGSATGAGAAAASAAALIETSASAGSRNGRSQNASVTAAMSASTLLPQPVSVHSLDVIVLACSKIGDEQRAMATLEQYPSFGVQPRTQSYNALLLACAGRNKARRHRVIFDAMVRRGVAPNYHTLRILIRQAVLCNNMEEALDFLERARTTPGVRMDVEMVLSVFEKACRVGDVETALLASKTALDADIGIDPAIIRLGAERAAELGVDASVLLQETLSSHEKLRGRHGIARKN